MHWNLCRPFLFLFSWDETSVRQLSLCWWLPRLFPFHIFPYWATEPEMHSALESHLLDSTVASFKADIIYFFFVLFKDIVSLFSHDWLSTLDSLASISWMLGFQICLLYLTNTNICVCVCVLYVWGSQRLSSFLDLTTLFERSLVALRVQWFSLSNYQIYPGRFLVFSLEHEAYKWVVTPAWLLIWVYRLLTLALMLVHQTLIHWTIPVDYI